MVITNDYGSVTSRLASLTVISAPAVVSQLPVTYTNLYTLYAGASPTFSITSVRGAQPISYQWYSNDVMVADATNTTFTMANLPVGGITNYCVLTNLVGTVTSYVWTAQVVLPPAEPYPQSVLGLSPMGYWRLNEPDNTLGNGNPGVVAHDYRGGNDGVYTNTYLGQPGYSVGLANQYGNLSLATDPGTTAAAVGSYAPTDSGALGIAGVDFSTPTDTSGAFSVAAWVNGTQTQTSGAGLVTKGYGNGGEQFNLDVYGANKGFRFFVRDAAGTTHGFTATVGLDSYWHHVVGVCDEPKGVVSLYIDGQLAGQGTITPGAGILASSEPMSIGARRSSATSGYDLTFIGSINDVALYDYALSAAQVASNYIAAGVKPQITQQPQGLITVAEGGVLRVDAAALGTEPLSYQWQDSSVYPSQIPDQTNATLVISNASTSLNYHSLYLTVTNIYGSVDSTGVQISVVSGPPQIVASNLPPQVVLPLGRSYTYSVQVVGTVPFGYQWSRGGGPVAGETTSSYTVTGTALGTSTISVTITNAQGSTGASSLLTVIAPPTDQYASSILALQPVGYWPLQETWSPAAATMETNYGTLGTLGTAYYAGTNAAALETGGNVSFGIAGALAGSGDYDPAVGFLNDNNNSHLFVPINSPALRLKAPMTFECWYNPNSGSPFGDIMGNGGAPGDGSGNWGGIRISYSTTGGGRLEAYCYQGSGSGYNSVNSIDGLTAGAWHQCVMTYDGATVVLYVDGARKNSAALAVADSDDVPLTVGTGRWDGGPTRTPSGAVDEVAVYTSALSPERVLAHYVAGTTPTGSNYVAAVEADLPLVYYRMDGVYTNPSPVTYPAAGNFGSSPVQGNYQSGVTPGGVPGPSILGLSSSLAAPINGVFSCVAAGYDPAFDPTGTQPFTAMTWCKGNPADNRVQCIMGQGQNWAMDFNGPDGHIVWNLYNGGQVTSTTVLNDGNWHFIAGVYDGVNSYLYVDGALDNSGLATGELTGEPNTDLYLGGNADYTFTTNYWGARYFAGALAQAACFTNALTGSQIKQLYDLASAPSLTLNRVGNSLIINYTGTLLSSTNVAGPYTAVPGARTPYPVPQTGTQQFYRTSNP